MRSLTLIANHKLNGSLRQTQAFVQAVDAAMANAPAQLEAIFCPSQTYIYPAIQAKSADSRLHIGAQTVSAFADGAHTGAVAASMLIDLGAQHSLVGHSEVRSREHINDADVAAAALACLHVGITPIICIGESEAEYKAGETKQVLSRQIASLRAVFVTNAPLMLAYEPVWAIGSGRTPSVSEIVSAHQHIGSCVHSFKEPRDTHVPVLYGGSVKSNNLNEILAASEVDGALIGSASLDAGDFIAMLHQASAALKG